MLYKMGAVKGKAACCQERSMLYSIVWVAYTVLHRIPASVVAEQMDIEDRNETIVEVDGNYEYSIWLSYSEIYNEKVFDLMIGEDGRLTPAGEKLAECPVEVSIARMLFSCKEYKCGEDILKIAAMVAVQLCLSLSAFSGSQLND
ncbi:hypothetical protein JB92DRAFT_2832328 [Gautieria morchelliformis]|nr:hypothetical protein JB92DRAFT_2832328 [Gautieria morchelliformis]